MECRKGGRALSHKIGMDAARQDHMEAYKEALQEFADATMNENKSKLEKIAARKKLNIAKDNLRAFELDLFEKDGQIIN